MIDRQTSVVCDSIAPLEDTVHPSLCRKVKVRVHVSGWCVQGGLVQCEPLIVAVNKCAATANEKPPLVPAPAFPAGAFPAVSLSPDARYVSYLFFF